MELASFQYVCSESMTAFSELPAFVSNSGSTPCLPTDRELCAHPRVSSDLRAVRVHTRMHAFQQAGRHAGRTPQPAHRRRARPAHDDGGD